MDFAQRGPEGCHRFLNHIVRRLIRKYDWDNTLGDYSSLPSLQMSSPQNSSYLYYEGGLCSKRAERQILKQVSHGIQRAQWTKPLIKFYRRRSILLVCSVFFFFSQCTPRLLMISVDPSWIICFPCLTSREKYFY